MKTSNNNPKSNQQSLQLSQQELNKKRALDLLKSISKHYSPVLVVSIKKENKNG